MMVNKQHNDKTHTIDTRITASGFDIIFNKDIFSVAYPQKIWKTYKKNLKDILVDNVALSSTLFVPQILGANRVVYKTARPMAEPYFFENGIYDMPICAVGDKKPGLDYIKNFFNVYRVFANNQIRLPDSVSFFKRKRTKRKSAIIPFSFGKESLLNVALCQEMGIVPILVNFIEPANDYEYFHKRKLIKKFELEFGLKVYTVFYGPGNMRYGHWWNKHTDLGWGLQTTEYALMSLPFVDYFDADYIVLGNEQSCNDIFWDKNGILSYKAAYDQHADWIAHQTLLSSVLLGRKVEVISLVGPLYELAITKILHHRYSQFGRYQMSCMADNSLAEKVRWCQHCVKCGYMYVLAAAFNFDLRGIGFTENLFDDKHASIYNHFFYYDPHAPQYGSPEELDTAFYLSYKNGHRGASITRFVDNRLKNVKKNIKAYYKKYLGVNSGIENLPNELRAKVLKIFQAELAE